MRKQRWAVKFIAPIGDAACFVGWQSLGGPLRSETTPECIALWETREAAQAFREARGIASGGPIGAGWVHADVVPLDLATLTPRPWWICGALYTRPPVILPVASSDLLNIPVEQVVQGEFAWGDQ